MILIPAKARTRSSLIAGIFVSQGAWCGDSTVSLIRQYDTFENWDVILYLQKKYGARGRVNNKTVESDWEEFRGFVLNVVPEGSTPVFKWIWYYYDLFHKAFGDEAKYIFPYRRDMHSIAYDFMNTKQKKNGGMWIDTDLLIEFNFKEIRRAVEFCGLTWNEDAARAVYDPQLVKGIMPKDKFSGKKVIRNAT